MVDPVSVAEIFVHHRKIKLTTGGRRLRGSEGQTPLEWAGDGAGVEADAEVGLTCLRAPEGIRCPF